MRFNFKNRLERIEKELNENRMHQNSPYQRKNSEMKQGKAKENSPVPLPSTSKRD